MHKSKAEHDKIYRDKHKQKLSLKAKLKYQDNKESKLEYQSQYYEENKDKVLEYQSNYYQKNKEKIMARILKYENNRRYTDPAFKLRRNVSHTIRQGIKRNDGSKRGKSIIKYLPYSFQELKQHLQSLFEPWMTWSNWGKYNPATWNDNDPATWTWELDHIIPQSLLPYTSMEENNFQLCWAISNLRPLSSKQNNFDGVYRKRHYA